MKRCYYLFAACFLCVSSLFAQGQIEADIRIFTFETPQKEILAELYLGVLSGSLKTSDSQTNKGIEVKLQVMSGNQITLADKYALTQSANSDKDFYHIQRILLKPGDYEFQLEIVDLSDRNNKISRVLSESFEKAGDAISISTIQLLGNVQKDETNNPLAKNGLVMEPLKFQYLNNNYKQLRTYVEVYRTDASYEGDYILRYDVIHAQGESRDTVLTRYKRRKAVPIDPILITEVNDTNWASGKYDLTLAVMDFKQQVKARAETSFVLSNPKGQRQASDVDDSFVTELSGEELNYALRALAPKVNQLDVDRLNHLIGEGSRVSRESFLYQFWALYSPLNPESGYTEYMEVVKALDNMYYDGLGHGFETDRGYIYLKYGQPDQQIAVEDEPSAPPYEIWVYSDFPATKQNNVKFVFYNPAATSYELLHSNARGEVNDPQWLLKLYRNSPEDVIGNPLDARELQANWNRKAAEIFNDN